MVNCFKCGKKDLGFFDRHKYNDDNGNRIFYCKVCDNEYIDNKKHLIEKVDKITGIMENFGFYESSDFEYTKLYDKPNLIYYEIDKHKTKLTFDDIIKQLKGKKINEANIKEIVDLELEKSKIKRREKKSKLREKAEKEVYGKVRTKRQTFDKDLKESIYFKYNNECAVCGGKEGLHIHHKDKDSKNNKMSNLILLCGVCHKKIHMRVR